MLMRKISNLMCFGGRHVFLMHMRDEDEESGCLMLSLYYLNPCDTSFTVLNVNAVRYLVMFMYLLVLILSKFTEAYM